MLGWVETSVLRGNEEDQELLEHLKTVDWKRVTEYFLMAGASFVVWKLAGKFANLVIRRGTVPGTLAIDLAAQKSLKIVELKHGDNSLGRILYHTSYHPDTGLEIKVQSLRAWPTEAWTDPFGERKTMGIAISAMRHLREEAKTYEVKKFKLYAFIVNPELRSVLERRFTQIPRKAFGDIRYDGFLIPAKSVVVGVSTTGMGTLFLPSSAVASPGPLNQSGSSSNKEISLPSVMESLTSSFPTLNSKFDHLSSSMNTMVQDLKTERSAKRSLLLNNLNNFTSPRLHIPQIPLAAPTSYTQQILQQPVRQRRALVIPPPQTYLESRMINDRPQFMGGIQTSVIQQCTGVWEASPEIIRHNLAGGFTITYPDTKEQVHLPAEAVPVHIRARAAPAPPPPPRFPTKYCGDFFNGKEMRNDHWCCPECTKWKNTPGVLYWMDGCHRSFFEDGTLAPK